MKTAKLCVVPVEPNYTQLLASHRSLIVGSFSQQYASRVRDLEVGDG
jgi:hypothetical protein